MNWEILKSFGEYFIFEGSFFIVSIISSILIDKWLEILFANMSDWLNYDRTGFFITFFEILVQFLFVGLFQVILREIFNQLQLTSTLFTESGTVGFSTNITRLYYSFIALGSQKFLKDKFNRVVMTLQDYFNVPN